MIAFLMGNDVLERGIAARKAIGLEIHFELITNHRMYHGKRSYPQQDVPQNFKELP